MWILRDALVTDRFDLTAFAVDCVVSRNEIQLFTWGFQGIVVFPSVCCVPKYLCFLRAQVFMFLACPKVCVSCVPKCLCLLCSQVFMFLAPKCLCLLCSQVFMFLACPSVCVCFVPKRLCLLCAKMFLFVVCSWLCSCVPECLCFLRAQVCNTVQTRFAVYSVCPKVSVVAPKT